jgi:hypothetical protein
VHEATRISSGKLLWFQGGFDRKRQIAGIAKLDAAAAESGTDVPAISLHECGQIIRREPTIIICKNDYPTGRLLEATISCITKAAFLGKKHFTA